MWVQRAVVSVAVLAGLLWAGVSTASADSKGEKMRTRIALARISMIDAIRAVESQTGGKVYKIEIKEDDGRIYYDVDFVVGNDTADTKVDAAAIAPGPAVRVVPPPAVVVPAVPARPAQPAQPQRRPEPAPTPQEQPERREPTQPQQPEPAEQPERPAPIMPQPQPTTPLPPSGIVIPFDSESAGGVPTGFATAETGAQAQPATWQIAADDTAPSRPNAVVVAQNPNGGSTFSTLLANQPVLANLEVSAKVKALAGTEAQGGGVIWRYQDAANYYVASWNPTDNALDVWRVKDGKRKRIGTGATNGDAAGWHEIRVEMRGDRIQAYFDGKKVVTERDFTFAEPGKVGFWVAADARAAFDDLTVAELDASGTGGSSRR